MYDSDYFFTFLETRGRNIHRGTLLDTAVRESAVNITQMVKKMGISRSTFYNHVKDPNLSYEQLANYGKTIKHDFSQDLPEMKRFVLEETEVPYITPKTIEEAIEQRDYWRERYYKKAEEYNRLVLDIKNEGLNRGNG